MVESKPVQLLINRSGKSALSRWYAGNVKLLTKLTEIKRLLAPVFNKLAILFAIIQCGARGFSCGVSFLASTTPYKSIRQCQSLSVAKVQCAILL